MRALIFAGALLAAFTLVAGCSKKEAPKTAEQIQAEKDAATKRSRDNPVYGDQLKTLDTARKAEEITRQRAEETRRKIEEQSK